jgi:hypothetical protein
LKFLLLHHPLIVAGRVSLEGEKICKAIHS